MLQNARVTAFTVFELLMGNQQGGGGVKLPPPPRLGLRAKTLANYQQKLVKYRC